MAKTAYPVSDREDQLAQEIFPAALKVARQWRRREGAVFEADFREEAVDAIWELGITIARFTADQVARNIAPNTAPNTGPASD